MDTEQFRLDRVADMERVSDRIRTPIARALNTDDPPSAVLSAIRPAFLDEYDTPGAFAVFDSPAQAWDWFAERITPGLAKATGTSSARVIADWLGTAIVNAARISRNDPLLGKMWLSRRDDRVRAAHRVADGQRQAWDDPFLVCGEPMMFPGDPVGDPACWVNCRCVAMPTMTPVFTLGLDDTAALEHASHDLIFYEDRRTPEVVTKGAKGKKGGPGTKAGKVVKRRPATAEEERAIARGDWVRVNRDGKKPGQPGYMDRRSKVRPQNNALEDTMSSTGTPRIDYQGGLYDENGGLITTAIPTVYTAAVDDDEDMQSDLTYGDEPVPFWAVLAPEGVWSGDKRRFADGALTNRDLPFPLLRQIVSDDRHKGSVHVGWVREVTREGNLYIGEGTFSDSEAADEIIGIMADGGGQYGISVDVDEAEMEFAEDGDEADGVTFTSARISAATIVPIPAFAEAVIHLGRRETADDEAMLAAAAREFAAVALTLEAEGAEFVSDSPWDGSASRFTPEQWKRSCVLHVCDGMEKSCHKLPIREPGGALNRNAVHNAAARFNQTEAPPAAKRAAAARLRSAYRELGEDPPEVLTASAEFKRGAGWVTHPKETSRLHRYWTKGKGAGKIRWGTSGDFTRCRRQLAKYIEPMWLNRVCAQWHHDALGYWPGELGRPGNPPDTPENRRRAARHARARASALEGCDECESVSLVAAARFILSKEAFDNPNLTKPTPITVTDDNRVWGHLALWDTCHVGIGDVCVTPPRTAAAYAYFLTGEVLTDDGPVPVGQITMDTGHADLSADPFAAKSHYDHTGLAVADVTAGEDQFGIWIAGHLRPGVDEDKVAALRAAGLSGDWRGIRGNLELVAALAVNVPGFPVPRTAMAASGGRQTALIRPALVPAVTASGDQATVADLAAAVVDEMESRGRRRTRAQVLADEMRRVRVARLEV